ncbi:MAG: hypothetical protein HY832_02480 [Candidatus Aenigmarchaeota archaeon]|nr:hypothetical protein [Candidatus Aenigmarchaeota archaeon]
MTRQNGLELPTSTIVIFVVVVLVLLVIGTFLLSSSGSQISRADAERIFRQNCQGLCKPIPVENYRVASELHTTNPEFLKACVALGYEPHGLPYECLEQCGCDMKVTYEEANDQLTQFGTEVNQLPP